MGIMLVHEVMTPDPHTVEVTATVRDAAALLTELDVRHLPVMESGNLVGILSDRDVRSLLGPDLEDPDLRAQRLDSAVSELMSSDVISVGPEDDLGEAIDLMIENRLGSLPVVNEDPDQLVGVVSYVDILRAARGVL